MEQTRFLSSRAHIILGQADNKQSDKKQDDSRMKWEDSKENGRRPMLARIVSEGLSKEVTFLLKS